MKRWVAVIQALLVIGPDMWRYFAILIKNERKRQRYGFACSIMSAFSWINDFGLVAKSSSLVTDNIASRC